MNTISQNDEMKKVLVTGFSPFYGMDVNPSWEGVRLMDSDKMKRQNAILFKQEIPVSYKYLDDSILKLWREIEPHLTIHVGYSDIAHCFTLETQACRTGYQLADSNGYTPASPDHTYEGDDVVITGLDVDLICKRFNSMETELKAVMSTNAGRYLCEYVYYASLCINRSQTLFVHVPPGYTLSQIAMGLERILELCLDQLSGCQ